MDQYNDDYVDVQIPRPIEDGIQRSENRVRGSSQELPTSPSQKPPLTHQASSSSSNYLTQSSLERSVSSHSDQTANQQQRPNLAEVRRMSAGGVTGGMSGSGSGTKIMGSLSGTTVDGKEDGVSLGFDENVLRQLCDMDGAMNLVADRIKQSITSCKQTAVFFRSRAEIEEKYARSLVELYRSTGDVYARADCKAGSFVSAYHAGLRLQMQIAEGRIRFSQRLNDMSDELLALSREGERSRKLHKENGMRYQGVLQESEVVMEKAKNRFDSTAEELERVLLAKEGESSKEASMRGSPSASNPSGAGSVGGKRTLGKAMKSGGMLFKGKGPGSMAKQEEDVRTRMALASETFRKAVVESQALRQEYFNFQLPKILRLLKECADEIDAGTQYHLARFAFMYESSVVAEGMLLNPIGQEDGSGLKAMYEGIDNRTDFKQYMQSYAGARGPARGPRREGPYEEGFLPRLPAHIERGSTDASGYTMNSTSTHGSGVNGTNAESFTPAGIPASTGVSFGVDLGEQLQRDGTEIPKVVQKCAEAIEAYGLDSTGIYRLSGTTSRIQALKGALDKDVNSVDVMSDEWTADINVVSGALKLWFRELPEPLLTYGLYNQFIDAARYENDRLRHIRLHEQVNELPDPNYATLKFFMGHLDRIRRKESVNQMSVSNLSIVFGPTLLGAPPNEGGLNLEHMSYQCKAIETILEKYKEIFVEEDDGTGALDTTQDSAKEQIPNTEAIPIDEPQTQ